MVLPGFENLPQDNINKNPMVRKHGELKINKKCKDCKFLLRVRGNTKVYSKCELRGVTSGKGTDHSMYWDACPFFKSPNEKQ